MANDDATFDLRGTVGREPRTAQGQSGPMVFFSVKVDRRGKFSYHDVVAFDDLAEDAQRLAHGAAVTVHGHLGTKSVKGAGYKGSDLWVTTLVAEKITSVFKAARPSEDQPDDSDDTTF